MRVPIKDQVTRAGTESSHHDPDEMFRACGSLEDRTQSPGYQGLSLMQKGYLYIELTICMAKQGWLSLRHPKRYYIFRAWHRRRKLCTHHSPTTQLSSWSILPWALHLRKQARLWCQRGLFQAGLRNPFRPSRRLTDPNFLLHYARTLTLLFMPWRRRHAVIFPVR